MATPPLPNPQQNRAFLDRDNAEERRSFAPWFVAAGLVLLVVVGLLIAYRRRPAPAAKGQPDAYASSIGLSNLQMSESGNLAGGKLTYVDGQVTNRGQKIVTGVTVQVHFRDFTGQAVENETMPLTLIRMRQPYIDTEPVSAEPLAPGASRDFRLIFEHMPSEWNQQYPGIQVLTVQTR